MADLADKKIKDFTLVDNTMSKEVKSNPKDKIEVEIGDALQPDLKPQFKIKRWDNEVNFSIRAEEDPDATVEVEGDKVKYKAKDYEVHLYEKPEAGEDGGFEFEWLLPKKPKTNVLTATIQTKGLDFFYQGELTQDEINGGKSRPENVVGSYAVYHKTKKNNKVGDKEYKIGKAFHIYRPQAIDANGDKTWCELSIDEQNGLLTVTVPNDFLDKAVYPVLVDPTFGYTTAGSSVRYFIDNDYNNVGFTEYAVGEESTAPASGTISKLTFYGDDGSSGSSPNLIGLVYEKDSDGTGSHGLVAQSSATVGATGPAWQDLTLSTAITADQNYILMVGGDSSTLSSGQTYQIYEDSLVTNYGKTTNGTSNTAYSLDRCNLSKHTCPANATLYLGRARVYLGSAGSAACKMVVYSDSSGSPNSLLAESDEVTVTWTTEQSRQFTFSGANRISMTASTDYWIGVHHADPGSPTFRISRDATASGHQYSNDTYSDGTNTTFSYLGTGTGVLDCYLILSTNLGQGAYVDEAFDYSAISDPLVMDENLGLTTRVSVYATYSEGSARRIFNIS